MLCIEAMFLVTVKMYDTRTVEQVRMIILCKGMACHQIKHCCHSNDHFPGSDNVLTIRVHANVLAVSKGNNDYLSKDFYRG